MGVISILTGLIVAPVASAIVYVDATRLGRRQGTCLLWAGGVGGVSFGGFLFTDRFADVVHRAYLLGVKPDPVVVSPLELLALDVAVGIAVSVASVVLYGLGSRLDLPRGG